MTDKKTFAYWIDIFINPSSSPKAKGQALQWMIKLAKTLEEKIEVFCAVSDKSKQKAITFAEIEKMADNFDSWKTIDNVCSIGSDYDIKAINEMIKYAQEFDHWVEIYCDTEDFTIEDLAIQKMFELAKTVEDYDTLIFLLSGGSENITKAIEKRDLILLGK